MLIASEGSRAETGAQEDVCRPAAKEYESSRGLPPSPWMSHTSEGTQMFHPQSHAGSTGNPPVRLHAQTPSSKARGELGQGTAEGPPEGKRRRQDKHRPEVGRQGLTPAWRLQGPAPASALVPEMGGLGQLAASPARTLGRDQAGDREWTQEALQGLTVRHPRVGSRGATSATEHSAPIQQRHVHASGRCDHRDCSITSPRSSPLLAFNSPICEIRGSVPRAHKTFLALVFLAP